MPEQSSTATLGGVRFMRELVSRTIVQQRINDAEAVLRECFDSLISIKRSKDNAVDAALSFQPKLADCLYSLMQFYKELQAEKRLLISKKMDYDTNQFSEVMANNAAFSKMVSEVINIGKNLGDAFAWLFYNHNRQELGKHYEHESTGLFVGGIGGLGEIEFIKSHIIFEGSFLLYHGITNILRVGDFSLYDVDLGIIGIGELKTQQERETLTVTANITAKTPQGVPAKQEVGDPDVLVNLHKAFPKLKSQLETQVALISAKEPEHSSNQIACFEYDLLSNITPDSPVAFNADKSLLLCGVWREANTLFERMEAAENFDDAVKIVTERTKDIVKPDSKFNKFIIANLDQNMTYMRIPQIWWDIDDNLCYDLYFKKRFIITVYNPATMMQRFADKGFSVESKSDAKETKLIKVIDDKVLRFEHFEALCDLVSHSLMKTEEAFQFAEEVYSQVERGVIPANTQVNMDIQLHSPWIMSHKAKDNVSSQ